MAAPLSPEILIQRIRASGLVPLGECDAILAELTASGGGTPPVRVFLDRLVADKYLTPFQADRLAIGKYKGFRLGSYVILDRLGTGGMGQVFLAEHSSLRRRAAIKVLSIPVDEDEIARERFYREARAAATLDHPNIVRVFDLSQEGQLLYLVMEFIEGVNLQTLVSRAGRLSMAAAVSYAHQTALGLQHAHDKGLIHRDIKPGNILVDRQGVARILDLGLVRSTAGDDSQLTMRLGGKKGVLGTVDYLAPEQAVDSSSVDARADIYSLGATLYYLLAGQTLFPEGRAAQKLLWQQSKEPTSLAELRPDLPAELVRAVHRALAKQPAERFPTATDFALALEPYLTGLCPPDPQLIPTPPIWRGLGRSADSGSSSRLMSRSSTRLASPAPRTGRHPVVPPSLPPTPFTPNVPPGPIAAERSPGPKSSSLLTPALAKNPASQLETASGVSDQTDSAFPAGDLIQDQPSSGMSSILSSADARALAESASPSAIGSPSIILPVQETPSRAMERGVPMPLVFALMAIAAVITGLVVWLMIGSR
jgi:serine/threonine protein kinase